MKEDNKKSKWKLFWEKKKLYKKEIKQAKSNKYQKPSEDVAISIQHLHKFFKLDCGDFKKALDNVSFDVKKGSFHGFIGDNGAGKTTTIRSILGFYPSKIGKIFINGIESTNKKSKELIGYIPEVSLFPKKIKVREYLLAFAKMSNLSQKQAVEKVDSLLKKYKFDGAEFEKSPEQLSSGQKKTVLLMQALLNDPEILIMDEPAANLDPSARVIFYEQIKDLNKQGKTIFISSHILLELERYIDTFTVLAKGKVLDHGTIEEKLKNTKYNKKINSSNNELIVKFLETNNFDYLVKHDYIYINIMSQDVNIIFEYCLKNKIEIYSFAENKLSLNELYFKAENSE
ncbi:ABC transporter ATP-binding protein [Mycoplasmopsis caviae]|uniref:ABC transporter ATP-binding protein n=1 Tax=Mycoplasmopsis caviae TaxID=55603 RepID=A0A3P8LAS8_9BACT|nr:ABC transporter ATP-binding protein [Mycoplasmopsis caviae]UUD35236.1 ABC transporter ATP-binding protein [Mycoplasmopsis caviae]VDR41981.1 ABC transporter ATP-binding protein [Mycoplasmopsis caviae]